MKNLIITTALISILSSCTEDEVKPGIDPFVGSWRMENADLGLQVTFDVAQEDATLSFGNVNIECPEITESLDYQIEPFGRFAVNTGYEEIEISGSGDQQWIIINMIHNRIHLASQDQLEVYTMEIHMVNRETIILQDQVFEKL